MSLWPFCLLGGEDLGPGRPMWSTQVVVQDEHHVEVITITTQESNRARSARGAKPNVKVGQSLVVSKPEAG